MKKIIFKADSKKMNSSLLELEKKITYPYGEDRFRISHGENYFSFFQRLGTPYWGALVNSEEDILSHMCAILRKVPSISGRMQRAWYVCDLKKDSSYSSTNNLKMLFKKMSILMLRCQKGYAISMDKEKGFNRLSLIIEKSLFLPNLLSEPLSIFSCDDKKLQDLLPLIKRFRGDVSYLNLSGKKDIIFEKEGKYPLLHLQFGKMATQTPTFTSVQKGYNYMWCAPSSDAFSKALIQAGCFPTATATIYSFRMKTNDWSWILTSEI